MKDPRADKIREYRKMLRGAYSCSLWKLFDRLHPESDSHWTFSFYSHDESAYWDRRKDEWIQFKTGLPVEKTWLYMSDVPADYRRDLNRQQRTKEKAALRKAFLDDDWEDFSLPGYRHNAAYYYW